MFSGGAGLSGLFPRHGASSGLIWNAASRPFEAVAGKDVVAPVQAMGQPWKSCKPHGKAKTDGAVELAKDFNAFDPGAVGKATLDARH